jgi:hypothetical protein
MSFGAQLNELWMCAAKYIPDIAAGWARANVALANTAGDASVFSAPGYVPGTPAFATALPTPVYEAWDRLRDEMQAVLAASVTNTYDSADALMLIAKKYAATDEAVAREFHDRNADYRRTHDDVLYDDPRKRHVVLLPE